jgi:hypothetical protein
MKQKLYITLSAICFMFLVVLLTTNCNFSKYSKEKASIDSLETMLNNAQKKLKEIDKDNVQNQFEKYKRNIDIIKANYSYDKKDTLTWNIIALYGNINKPLKTYLKQYAQFEEDINYSKKQIKNLFKDYKKKRFDKAQFKEYLETEANIISNQCLEVSSTIDFAKSNLKLLDSLNPKIDLIIKKIKKTNNNNHLPKERDEEEDDND